MMGGKQALHMVDTDARLRDRTMRFCFAGLSQSLSLLGFKAQLAGGFKGS